MIPKTSKLRRWAIALAVLPLLVGMLAPISASAATRLFAVSNDSAEIWEINPVTGALIAKFSIIPAVLAARPGLAFNGTELFYTDENLAVIQVYSTAGALLRTLPKPAGQEPGNGMGASLTELYIVDFDGNFKTLNPLTGAVLNSFSVPDARQGLAFAGSRGTLFVAIADTTQIKEINLLTGAVVNTINVIDIFRGLGFSSSNGVLYGTRAGILWAVNPDTGALLPGYPVEINNAGVRINKSGALAADEPLLESCGDGTVNVDGETCDPPSSTLPNGNTCRADCTYCGDGNLETSEQCDDGNSNDNDACRNDCTLSTCGDGIQDAGEGCDDGCLLGTPNVCEPGVDDGDGCSATCTVEPFCGDGVVDPQLGEQCELPNTPGCDANCHAPEICNDLIDNDGDGQIDCSDPDCDCLPIGRDPGAIRFGQRGDGDLFAVHGSLDPSSALNVTTEKVSFLLTKSNGTVKIFQLEIPAGDVKQIGRNLFRFRNRLAQKNRQGLARFDLRYFPKKDTYTFIVKAYGDLSLATEAEMAVQLVIGDDDTFFNKSTWLKLPKGWLLALPGE